jgi:predicted RNase H-like HicB family nuclease
MAQYIALIHKDKDSDFGVSFPDFPGVITAAGSLEEARGMAEEALAFHIEGMTADGEPIPEPSSLDTVMGHPNNRDGVAILVAADVKTKAVRVTITMPEDILREVDQYAEAHGFTRSGFLTRAAKREMNAA